VLAPADNYYTKYQVDQLIESATTSGCCITPEEVDEKIEEAISGITISGVTEEQMDEAIAEAKAEIESEIPTVPTSNTAFTNDAGYITEHQSLSGYATEQWVENKGYITGVDLSDYVTYESLPDLRPYATKQWVINQSYVSNSELIKYITNLQNQIDSLRAEISGCCGDTGETLIRWITMTGENDYTCSGTTKMTKEKEQQSTDGGNTWTDTGNYRAGSTVLEINSIDCGFVPSLKYTARYTDSSVSTANCDGNNTIVIGEISKTNLQSIDVGDCVTAIDSCVFCDIETLTDVSISSSLTAINDNVFLGCHHLTSVTFDSNSHLSTIGSKAFEGASFTEIILPNTLTTIGESAFDECYYLNAVTIPSGVTSIGSYAFWGVGIYGTSSTSFTIEATVPPTLGENAFANTNDCPILVPASSVNAYKAAWATYDDRIRAIQ
jgi:hypothetical protein